MKLLITAVVLFVSVCALAIPQDVTCVNRDAKNSKFSAEFVEIGDSDSRVTLTLPLDENEVRKLYGVCEEPENSTEFSMLCNVSASWDEGFEVHLFTKGKTQLFVSITSWTIAGPAPAVVIACK